MKKNYDSKIAFSVFFATILWFVIFVVKPANFWFAMSCGIFLLIVTVFLFDREVFKLGKLKLRYLGIGVGSAVVLYGVFYIGNYLAAFVIPAKDSLIHNVYMNKAGTNPAIIITCLLLIIGPGEELFWRGYIQKSLSIKFGSKSIFIAALLYTAVHVVTLNLMLIMASLVCGLFWGALFYKEKSLYPVIISHALWDITIFLLLPLN